MKVHLVILYLTYLTSHHSTQSAVLHSRRVPQLYELTQMDKADLAYLRHYARPKRSGSGDILNHLKSSISKGIKSKLSHIAKGSASASSHFSGSGDYAHNYGHGYYIPDESHHKPDVWSFKKSILYTVLQALKAIKGGVIAVKGQLIKGGGHLLQAKGKIIRGGGEVLTNLGKSIATSAFMIMPSYEEEHVPDYHEYPPHPPSYSHSSPEGSYHHPSEGAVEYPPSGYAPGHNAIYEGKGAKPEHDGIVIIKKIPSGHTHHEHEPHEAHEAQATHTQDFKPLPPNTPLYHEPSLVESIFSASSGQKDTFASSNSPHFAGTSYGTPSGHPYKYTEYNKKQPETFVTPTPEHEQIEQHIQHNQPFLNLNLNSNTQSKPQVLIGMKMPYNNLHNLGAINLEQLLRNNDLNFKIIPTPNTQEAPTQFLIEYPDPTEALSNNYHIISPAETEALSNNYRIISPAESAHYKKTHKVKKPDFEVLKSIAFEIKP